MNEPMTAEDFAFKVDHEGGVMSALQYGLKPEDAPEGPIRDLWTKAYELWEEIDPIRYDLGILLEEIRENANLDEAQGAAEDDGFDLDLAYTRRDTQPAEGDRP